MLQTWAKGHAKYDGHNVEPNNIIILGSGGTDKYHLVKMIYNAVSKKHCFITVKT